VKTRFKKLLGVAARAAFLVFCPTNNFTGMKPICYGPVEVEGDGQAEYRLDD
jgi:hypothetical protein